MVFSIHKANKILHKFSGEDLYIIEKLDDPKINRNFNLIGLSVILICLGCLYSAFSFVYNVMDKVDKLWSIPIGIFWGFTVTIIYVLLLYTITPVLLMDRSMTKKKKARKNLKNKNWVERFKKYRQLISISMLLRVLFISVFAIIIAQPINVLFFKGSIERDLEFFRECTKSDMIFMSDSSRITQEKALYEDFHEKIYMMNPSQEDQKIIAEKLKSIDHKIRMDVAILNAISIINVEISKLNKKVGKKYDEQKKSLLDRHIALTDRAIHSDNDFIIVNQHVTFQNPSLQKAYKEYITNIDNLIQQKKVNNQNISNLIDDNNFYLRQIIFVNQKTIGAKLMNFLFIVLFIGPIYLKFQIRKIIPKHKKGFYEFKEQLERSLVVGNYRSFKRRIESLFNQQYKYYYQRAIHRIEPQLTLLEKVNPSSAQRHREEIQERYNYQFSLYEKYLDPPFNLKDRVQHIRELSQDDFINDY